MANSQQWLKLLHYKSKWSRIQSDVTSSDFFFDENGRYDSSAELNATIRMIFGKKVGDPKNIHCKFPARIKWLSSQLNLSTEQQVSFKSCQDYQKWKMQGNIKSISLIFASGHLSNPASFYGHILLKFNSEIDGNELNLLDTSINFGAKPPENENALVYIAKGLTGGYQGLFTNQIFYRHNHTYAENELRDLWNYELNLNQQQLDTLIDHSWELLGQEFTYYFLKQNCGYRMAELINLVVDTPLLPASKGWAMPSDMLEILNKQHQEGIPLVKKITLIESRQNSFRNKYLLLEQPEKKLVSNFINIQDHQKYDFIQHTSSQASKKVIDTLFDYYAFSLTKKGIDISEIESRRRTLLLQRLKLDTAEINWGATKKAHPPHESQKSSLLQISPFYNNILGSGAEIRFRAAYYDFLSFNSGRAPFTQMSMLDLRVIHQNNKISLRQLELLNIETLNPSPTGLPEDKGYAWKIKVGVKNSSLGCTNCLNVYIGGGIGKAYSFGQKTALYGMVVGEIVSLGAEKTQLKPGLSIGIITGYQNWFSTQFEAGFLKSITSNHEVQKFVSLESRFSNENWWDIRIKFIYDKATELRFGLGFYW